MIRHRACLSSLLLLALLGTLAAAQKPSLAEVAREARRKKALSTSKVWTNDDLRGRFPEIKRLRPSGNDDSLSPYAPTPLPVVEAMLRMADVQPGEMVFDLGSGDGRIVIMAAEKFGAHGVGIELDQKLAESSQRTVQAKGLKQQVRIFHANVLDVDLSPADVVTLYLTPEGIEKLRPHLERTLRPGTRVVSHRHRIRGWKLEKAERVGEWNLLFYVIR